MAKLTHLNIRLRRAHRTRHSDNVVIVRGQVTHGTVEMTGRPVVMRLTNDQAVTLAEMLLRIAARNIVEQTASTTRSDGVTTALVRTEVNGAFDRIIAVGTKRATGEATGAADDSTDIESDEGIVR